MATIDSRIALGFQPQTQLENPANALARVLQVQGAQQQNQLGQMKLDEYKTASERRNKLASLLQGQYETPEARESALLQGGFMDESQQLAKGRLDAGKAQADIGKTKADTEKTALATQREKISFLGQLLNGVRDQTTYDQARAIAQQNGLDVSSVPPQYNPAMIEQAKAQALTVEEQLAQVWKQKGYDLDVRQQSEVERNNRTQNAISQGNLRVAQGNQSLSRERLDFDKSKPLGTDGRPAKPMPATALKMQNEALDVIGIASSTQADLGSIRQKIKDGALEFGPVKNLINEGRNATGLSNEQSRNLATFKSTLEKLRNDSLRLNKGVQTDGDAQRAWSELLQNINDPVLVDQRLGEIERINARAVDLRKKEVEDIRNNYNQQQYDFGAQTNVPSVIAPSSNAGMPTADAIEAELKRRAEAKAKGGR